MKIIILLFVSLLFVGCTTTHIKTPTFEASNTSIGWERENVGLALSKKPDDTQLQVTIGKSGGSESFDRAITGLETTMDALKSMRP